MSKKNKCYVTRLFQTLVLVIPFVAMHFVQNLLAHLEFLPYMLEIFTPMVDSELTDTVYKLCDIEVNGKNMPANLIDLPISEPDVIWKWISFPQIMLE